MQIKIKFLLALPLVLILCACNSVPKVMGTPENDTLPGSSWILRDIDGQAVLTIYDVTLEFTDTEISGFGGCNRFQGTFSTTPNDEISVSFIMRTKKACQDEKRSDNEGSLVARLESAVTYAIDSDTLIIKSDLGSLGLSRGPARKES